MRRRSEGKRKFAPIHDIQTYEGGEVWIPSFLKSSIPHYFIRCKSST